MTLTELDKTYVAGTYSRFPLEIVEGSGCLVRDSGGREYIDMGSGIAVNTFGFADSRWAAAVTAQLSKLQHMSNLYYTEPCAVLAKMLCEKTGMKKVFFSNSGAEANECAIKTARKYSAHKYGELRHTIITLENSFHGRTITTLAATGQAQFHRDFKPLTPGFAHVKPGDIRAVEEIMGTCGVAAIMIELIQGEGGVVPLDSGFVNELAQIARENDILLICDEIQTGSGRTGKLLASMNYGITPDIVTAAKGLAGGLPLGATLFGEKTAGVLGPGDHGSTFGGNPVCCAGAVSILERIDDELLREVRSKSDYIFGELSGAEGVSAVTGMGLMLGIETKKSAQDVLSACMERGVLVLTAKNRIRLLPPLNIPFDLLKKAVGVIKSACAE